MSNWYFKSGNKTTGPLTLLEMIEFAAEGKIQETDLVREGLSNDFVPASQIPELNFNTDGGANDSEIPLEALPLPEHRQRRGSSSLIFKLVALAGCFYLFVFILNVVTHEMQQSREYAHRLSSLNQLRLIGLGVINYASAENGYRLPVNARPTEKSPRHGWLTAILPYIGETALYQQIDFDQPWSAPVNHDIFQQKLSLYLNPAISEVVSPEGYGLSHYVGNANLFNRDQGLDMGAITDGLSTTIMILEAGENFVPWGAPTNAVIPSQIMGPGNKPPFSNGRNVILADGAGRFISDSTDPAVLKAMSTPAGGEPVEVYEAAFP